MRGSKYDYTFIMVLQREEKTRERDQSRALKLNFLDLPRRFREVSHEKQNKEGRLKKVSQVTAIKTLIQIRHTFSAGSKYEEKHLLAITFSRYTKIVFF